MNGFQWPALWDRPRRGRLVRLLGVLTLQVSTMALTAWFTRVLFLQFGNAHGSGRPTGWIPAWGSVADEAAAGLALCAILLLSLRSLERRMAEALAHDYTQDLRIRLLKRLASLGQSQLHARALAQVTARLSGDMTAVRQWVSQGVPRLLVAVLALPAFAAVLVWLDPQLAAAGLAPVVVSLLALAAMGSRLRQAHEEQRRERASLTLQTLERLRIAPMLRMAGGLQTELKRLHRQADKVLPQAQNKALWSTLARHLPELGCALGAALVLMLAVRLDRSAADAAASLAALGLLATTLGQLADVWDRWHAWSLSRSLLLRILQRRKATRNERSTEAEAPPEAINGTPSGSLTVGVYNPQPQQAVESWTLPALHSNWPTVRIARGDRVSISGPSGCGKSFWLRVVAGLEGSVDTNLATLNIALISAQGPWLRGSLEKNLTLGLRAGESRDALAQAAIERFALHGLQSRLALGDGRVHESGANLSTRERVLILLARAWLQAPDLLLLDLGDWPLDQQLRQAVIQVLTDQPQMALVSVSAEPVDWDSFPVATATCQASTSFI